MTSRLEDCTKVSLFSQCDEILRVKIKGHHNVMLVGAFILIFD